jgi:uncharacterized protein (DUF1697 family)
VVQDESGSNAGSVGFRQLVAAGAVYGRAQDMPARVPMHVALLRAVNLAGHNRVASVELRALMAKLALEDGKTLLASGNLVFGSAGKTPAALEALLAAGAQKQLGLATDFFVRTAREWSALIAGNPFTAEAKSDPSHLVLMTFRDAPGAAQVAALEAAITGRERIIARGRHGYLVYPDGIGRSRLTVALIERKLGTRGTGRNWNTVLKLAAMMGD